MAETKSLRFDVAISGAGFAGLALAHALSVALGSDFRVALVDPRSLAAADDPAMPQARASALTASSVRMLEVLGIWDEIRAQAQPVTSIDITDSSLDAAVRPIVLTYDNHISGGEPASVIVENHVLKAALVGAVVGNANVTRVMPVAVQQLVAQEHTAELHLSDGNTLTAALAVAADGRASHLRKSAGIRTTAWSHGQIGIVTIIRHSEPHNGCAVQHFLPAGPFAVLPLTGGRSCVTWSEDAEAGATIMAAGDDDFLADLNRRLGHRLGTVSLAGSRASFPLETRIARAFVAPRLALIGDAACAVHPIAGQGLNLGLRDVAALAEVIADTARLGIDIGSGEALDRYERWRRFDSVASLAAFDGLNRLFSNDNAALRMLRDAGLGVVDRLPGLKGAFVRQAAGVAGELPRLLTGAMV